MSRVVEEAARLMSRYVPRQAQRATTRYEAATRMAQILAGAGFLINDSPTWVRDLAVEIGDLIDTPDFMLRPDENAQTIAMVQDVLERALTRAPVLSDADRAVLDAAEAETKAEQDFMDLPDSADYDNADWAENQCRAWLDIVEAARETRRAAVRVRRETSDGAA
jgi:hypothetical protein